MSSNTIIGIVVLLLLGLGAWYFLADSGAQMEGDQADDTQTNEVIDTEVQRDMDGTSEAASDQGDGRDERTDDTATGEETDTDEVVVNYTDEGFAPETVTIAAGAMVRFVNESDREMWVAVDVHPIHADFDGTSLSEHCPDTDNAVFDQCETGDTYSFTFAEGGRYAYHNHVSANHTGVIVVE